MIKQIKSKIICITGDCPKGILEVSRLLNEIYTTSHSKTIRTLAKRFKASKPGRSTKIIDSLLNKKSITKKSPVYLVHNFPNSILEVTQFVDQVRDAKLPQDMYFINVQKNKTSRNTSAIAVHYAESLFRDGGGAAGTVIFDDSSDKLTIDVLSLMAQHNHQVALGGMSGCGKGTMAAIIGKVLGYKIYSVGNDVTRRFAKKNGYKDLSLDDVVKLIKSNKKLAKKYDLEADSWQRELGKSETRFVLESRLSAKWLEGAFKVFITLISRIAGERRFQQIKDGKAPAGQKVYKNVKEVIAAIVDRNKNDLKRYKKDYKYDPSNVEHYHLIIDTDVTPIEGMAYEFLKGYKKFLLEKIG